MTGRETREYAVLGFGSTHDALTAESALKAARFDILVIPAPRALGSLCGIAIRLEPEVVDAAERLLEDARLAPTARATIRDV